MNHRALLALFILAACSEPRTALRPPPIDAGSRIEPTPDAGTPTLETDAGVSPTCEAGPRDAQMVTSIHEGATIFDETRQLLIAIPKRIDDGIVGLTAIDVAGEQRLQLSAVIDSPLVEVLDARYDRNAAHTVVLAINRSNGAASGRLEFLTLTIDDTNTATLRRHEPTNAPNAQRLTSVFPEGDGTHYRALRWSSSTRATLTNQGVTWEDEVELTYDGPALWIINPAHDAVGHRVFLYGERASTQFLPTIWEMPLNGPPHFTRAVAMGDAPPIVDRTQSSEPMSSTFYDSVGERLVALVDREVPLPNDPTETIFVTGAWAFEAGTWTKINDDIGQCCGSTPFGGLDNGGRRLISFTNDGFAWTRFDPGHEGELEKSRMGTVPYPWTESFVFDADNGRMIGVGSAAISQMNLRDEDFVWRPLLPTEPSRPNVAPRDFAAVVDGNRIVTFGGTRSRRDDPSTDVHVLQLDDSNPTWTVAPTTGPHHDGPIRPAVVLHPQTRSVYFAGGGDTRRVSRLQLDAMVWETVAELPEARTGARLRIVDDNVIELAFGSVGHDPTVAPNAIRIRTDDGQIAPIAFRGALPTGEAGLNNAFAMPCGWMVAAAAGAELRLYEERQLAIEAFDTGRDAEMAQTAVGAFDTVTGHAYLFGRTVWRLR